MVIKIVTVCIYFFIVFDSVLAQTTNETQLFKCVRWKWTDVNNLRTVQCLEWKPLDCSNRLYPAICRSEGTKKQNL